MIKKLKKQKVLCAMSGGIDSSVSAYLLKEANDFEVIGVFLKFWSESKKDGLEGSGNRCCSLEAEKRARALASKLGIPFYVLNFENIFKERIVNYFLEGYKKGVTPNPCVVCNKEIKFGLLLNKARQLGANLVATGHYARIRQEKDVIKLIKGKDKNKDQSYFLWKLNQNQLKHILFPVGGYTKNEVKKMAKKFKLHLTGVLESQEICFVESNTKVFLKNNLNTKPGKIADVKGRVMGEHEGLWFYTIGQRKGIKLSQGPFYVIDKDFKRNLLVVSKNKKDLQKKEAILKKINWVSGKEPKLPLRVKIKIRYRHKAVDGIITGIKKARYKIQFKVAQGAVTPGQSAVFYKKDELLGGGIIC